MTVRRPVPCGCGCGAMTGGYGNYLPGHSARVMRARSWEPAEAGTMTAWFAEVHKRSPTVRSPRLRFFNRYPCRRCHAAPGWGCVTISGNPARRPHAERINDAMPATGRPFKPLAEGRWVPWSGTRPEWKPRPLPPADAYDARPVAAALAHPDMAEAIKSLEELRWTGRPGYPVRTMVGAVLVKSVYALPTWTRTARLVAEHAALREAIGGAPSNWACYRFAATLREHGRPNRCIARVLASLRDAHPAQRVRPS